MLEKFIELGLSEKTLSALRKKGFTEPTAIQAAAIPLLLEGKKDVIGQALTGTGKSAAFGLPIIECLEPSNGVTQALILSPTRELAMQLAKEIESLSGNEKLKVLAVYGGQSIELQLKKLRKECDIVVGTPGRVMDLIERKALSISQLKFAVLDEADEMLDMGFVEDIEKILSFSNPDKRMLLFSATMPPEIISIAKRFMREYELINVKAEQTTNAALTTQIYYELKRADKVDALMRLVEAAPEMYAIVFCRTRGDVDDLTEELSYKGIRAESLHGDINQAQRTKVIEGFKEHRFNLLIATDVAARGIDVNSLTHVINYSIPETPEIYVHRIGRTARAGNSGIAITFVTPSEVRKIATIKRELKVEINKQTLPSGKDIVKGKINALQEKLSMIIENNHHKCYFDIADKLLEENDARDVTAAILRHCFKNEFSSENYKKIGEVTGGEKGPRSMQSKKDLGPQVRLFVGIGKKDGVGAKKMLDLIFEKTKIKSWQIGKIDCFDKFSYINVPEALAHKIIDKLKSGRNRINVDYAEEKA